LHSIPFPFDLIILSSLHMLQDTILSGFWIKKAHFNLRLEFHTDLFFLFFAQTCCQTA
jgi:hypothetical protein